MQKGVRTGSQRGISGREDGDGENGSGALLLQPLAELRSQAAVDHQLDDRELRPGWVMGLANHLDYLIVDAINGKLYNFDPQALEGFSAPELYELY